MEVNTLILWISPTLLLKNALHKHLICPQAGPEVGAACSPEPRYQWRTEEEQWEELRWVCSFLPATVCGLGVQIIKVEGGQLPAAPGCLITQSHGPGLFIFTKREHSRRRQQSSGSSIGSWAVWWHKQEGCEDLGMERFIYSSFQEGRMAETNSITYFPTD